MECKNSIAKIPVAIQFCFDDVGWYNGRDLRYKSMASRSGLPRNHAIEDYEMLHEFGKALGQKILTPLCLADWDKDNLLRGHVGITHDPYGWDVASVIDMEHHEKARDIINSSEYIEPCIHGLLHGVYAEDGKLITENEYFKYIEVDGKRKKVLNSPEDFNNRMSLFFKIYESWGFTKKIRTFVSPCGFGDADDDMILDLAERVEKLGVKYWANGGFTFEGPLGTYRDIAVMKKGGSYNGKYGPMPPWEGYDLDPDLLMPFVNEANFGGTNMIGMHWTNLLRLNPKRNLKTLPRWIDYFNRERETFGTMIAKDVEFSVTQQFYNLYSKIDLDDGKIVVDVAGALAKKTTPCKDEFYISLKKDITPKSCTGGSVALYEKHDCFNTYKIEHFEPRITIFI